MTDIQNNIHQYYTPTKVLFFNNLAVDLGIKDLISIN